MDTWIVSKDFRCQIGRNVLVVHQDGKIYAHGVKGFKPDQVLAKHRDTLAKKGTILNDLPFDQALVLYRKHG